MMVVGEEERFVWYVYITAAAIVRMLKRRALLVLLQVHRFNNFFLLYVYIMVELSCIYCSFYHLSFSPRPSHLSLSLSLSTFLFPSLYINLSSPLAFPSIPFFLYISLPISKMPLTTSTCGRAVL